MLSISVQGNLPACPFNNLSRKTSLSVNPKAYSLHPWQNTHLKIKPLRRIHRIPVATEVSDETLSLEIDEEPQMKEQIKKPRLLLKFIWMDKNIGLGLDQIIPDHGTVPMSPYYFWPRKDAWEELKTVLESKSWISQKKMIILLNQATDIINLWQQSGGNIS